jgi:hypothetical protein
MKRIVISLVVLVLGGLASSHTVDSITNPETVLVETKLGPITVADLLIHSRLQQLTYQNPLETAATNPFEDIQRDAADLFRGALRQMVVDRHLGHLALSQGTTLTQEQQLEIRDREFRCGVASLTEKLRETITTVPQEIAEKLREEAISLYTAPERRSVLYIFQEIREGEQGRGDGEVRQRLEKVREDIVSEKLSFAKAAEQFSEASSAKDGGRIGYVTLASPYSRRFVELVFATPQGVVSPVTRIRNGYYIVTVEGILPERTAESERRNIEFFVLSTFLEQQVKEQLREARRRFPVSVSNEDALIQQQREEGTFDPLCDQLTSAAILSKLAGRFYLEGIGAEKVTEEDARAYYEKNSWMARKEGFWKLTRVQVLAGPGTPYPSGIRAAEVAGRLRNEVLAGTEIDMLQEKFPGLKFEVDSTDSWIRSTDHGQADRELAQMKTTGTLTGLLVEPTRAKFYRLDDLREVPLIPFEEMRSRMEESLQVERLMGRFESDRTRIYRELVTAEPWRKLIGEELAETLWPITDERISQ